LPADSRQQRITSSPRSCSTAGPDDGASAGAVLRPAAASRLPPRPRPPAGLPEAYRRAAGASPRSASPSCRPAAPTTPPDRCRWARGAARLPVRVWTPTAWRCHASLPHAACAAPTAPPWMRRPSRGSGLAPPPGRLTPTTWQDGRVLGVSLGHVPPADRLSWRRRGESAAGRAHDASRLDRLVARSGRVTPERPLHLAVMHADAEEEAMSLPPPCASGSAGGAPDHGVHKRNGRPWGPASSASPSSPVSRGGWRSAAPSRTTSSAGDGARELPAPRRRRSWCERPRQRQEPLSREPARYPGPPNSDALRRALSHPTHVALESARLFAAVHALLARLLSGGVSAVLDATSLKEEHRRPPYDTAQRVGAGLILGRTEAPEAVALGRLAARARGSDPARQRRHRRSR
jgi:hypothetical protein